MTRRWTHDCDCSFCGKKVGYHDKRRRCLVCSAWLHEGCGYDPFMPNHRVYCQECFMADPVPVIKGTAVAVSQNESTPALEVVVWSMFIGQDEDAISSTLGIPRDEVRRIAQSYIDNDIWKDGKLCLDYSDGDDPDEVGGQIAINLVMCSMVADGLLVRVRVDEPDPSVPEIGGTEQDGKQEGDQGDDPGDSAT